MPRSTARKYSYPDLLYTPSEGFRFEIIDGALYVDGSPARSAHRVGIELGRALSNYFAPRGFELRHAPADVVGRHYNAVFPAIVIDHPFEETSEPEAEPPPVLVVEFLSSNCDFRTTGLRCAERGIPHYWEVDAKRPLLTCFGLEDGVYRVRVPWISQGVLTHPDFEDMAIDVSALWDGPPGHQSSGS